MKGRIEGWVGTGGRSMGRRGRSMGKGGGSMGRGYGKGGFRVGFIQGMRKSRQIHCIQREQGASRYTVYTGSGEQVDTLYTQGVGSREQVETLYTQGVESRSLRHSIVLALSGVMHSSEYFRSRKRGRWGADWTSLGGEGCVDWTGIWKKI